MKIAICIFVLLISTTCLFSQSGQPDAVTQSWNEVEITVPLIQKVNTDGKKVDQFSAIFNGILRTSRLTHMEDRRAGFGLSYRLSKYFSMYAALLYRRDEIVKNVPHIEKRLDIGPTFSITLNKFTIRDRNMYEHRYRNGRVNTDFYRQRFQVFHPLNYKGKTLFTPYVSEEVYFQIHARQWVQSEFYAGISRRLNTKSVLEIAYIRNDVRPVNNNGLSLTLRVKVR
jgi:hypothetical protein